MRDTEERPHISLEQFKKAFRGDDRSYRKHHTDVLKQSIDALIETADWDCDEAIQSEHEMCEAVDCIVYYMTGSICKKMRAGTECIVCQGAFNNRVETLINGDRRADLVNVKSRGGLIHSNLRLFNMFNAIEGFFSKHNEQFNAYELII